MKVLPPLSSNDLKWLQKMLEEDLAGLIGYETMVMHSPETGNEPPLTQAVITSRPVWDFENKRIFLPLKMEDQVLAVSVLNGILGLEGLSRLGLFMGRLASLTLQKFQLTRSLVLDPVTGLFTRAKLLEELAGMMVRETERMDSTGPRMEMAETDTIKPGLALVMVKMRGVHTLIKSHGRHFLRTIQKRVAEEILDSVGHNATPARLGDGVFAWLEPGLDADQASSKTLSWIDGVKCLNEPALRKMGVSLVGGMASYPHNLPGPWDFDARDDEDDVARDLEELAGRALAHADRQGAGVLSLDEVRKHCGQVVEILPLNRLVIDLGRQVGAEEGMLYRVAHHSDSASDVYKAEVAILNVSPEQSTAEITVVEDERFPVQVGDRLELKEDVEGVKIVAADEKAVKVADHDVKVLIDQPTGLPNSRSISPICQAMAVGIGKFAMLVVRLDGLIRHRSLVGQKEADLLLVRIAEMSRNLAEGTMVARAGVESLSILIPGVDEETAFEMAKNLKDKAEHEVDQGLTIGVSYHPFAQSEPEDAFDRALKALDHASFPQADPIIVFDAISLNVSGDRLYHQGDIEGACVEYEKALAVDPENVNVLNSLGACYGQLNRLDEAVSLFEQGATLAVDDFMAWYNLGLVHRSLGRAEEAFEALTKAHDLNNNDFAVLFALGQLCLDQGQNQAAAEWFGKAEKSDSTKTVVHRWLGEALIRVNRADAALRHFRKAVKLNPTDAASLSWLGRLYMDKDRDKEVALSLTKQAVELEPNNPVYRERYGRALVKIGQANQALEEYRSALAHGERNPDVLWGMGLCLAALGKFEKSVDTLGEAAVISPDNQELANDLDRVTAELDRINIQNEPQESELD